MIKGIIFDFDNTLYDYDRANTAGLERTFRYISETTNIDLECIEKTYRSINKSIKGANNPNNKFNKSIYFKQLVENLKLPLTKIGDYLDIYHKTFSENFQLYDGVRELLTMLKQRKIRIGLLTNNIFMQQYDKLCDADILQYVDVIVSSDEVGQEKPSPHMYNYVKERMNLSFEELAYVGDNYEHDIEPSITRGMLTFWYTHQENKSEHVFNDYGKLRKFLEDYFASVEELIFLSKYFGQSIVNVQGPGGNISIKMENYLFIKSSGSILGNMSYDQGYCIVDNEKCNEMVKTQRNQIKAAKIFGRNSPSMETYFHSFMKKYTVHLHFTLSNIFFCNNTDTSLMEGFEYGYEVVEYYTPGLELASEIYKQYSANTDIYILKNHGIIITSNSQDELINKYNYLFDFFNRKLENKYSYEKNCNRINQMFYKNGLKKVIRRIPIESILLRNIVYCFPDLAIFVQKKIEVSSLEELERNMGEYDIIILEGVVYGIADSLTKLYSLIEILESYRTIYEYNNGNLSSIDKVVRLQNMEEEKDRRNL
jgi:putative hydrolase of the HAD superfamily